MSKILLVAFFALSASAQAGEVKTEILFPTFQKRPILALLTSELNDPPLSQIGYAKSRANRICEFLRQPAGSFRSRTAENVLTKSFQHDGKMAVLEKLSNGSIRSSLVLPEKTEYPEVVKSLRCVGTN